MLFQAMFRGEEFKGFVSGKNEKELFFEIVKHDDLEAYGRPISNNVKSYYVKTFRNMEDAQRYIDKNLFPREVKEVKETVHGNIRVVIDKS